jgi:pyruvate dehydrogenase E2 component (dihydrolipoamide acetyltransferase)
METGVISQWLVKVGDQVKEGDILADVETDKATMQMTAYEEGIVAHLDHNVGDEVALGDRVLVLAKKGEDPKKVAASLGGAQAQPARAAKPAVAAHEPQAAGATPNGQKDGAAEDQAAEPGKAASGGRIKSSPLARKVAAASAIDLSRVKGTGPGGRVVRADVEAYLEARGRTPTLEAPARSAPAAAATARPVSARPRATERIPHTRMRKTIAARMVEAKKSAPEIHVTVEIRVDQLVAIRERLNQQLSAEKVKLSLGDFVTKAVALALVRHPGVNASFEVDAIVHHGEVNIGIAVALDGGLIVPVLKNADQLGLREIRIQSEALVTAARNNKLVPEQMTGATFTISNLGMYGVRQFDAILNPPEVAILAVSAAEKRPVVVGDSLTVGTLMTVTITADHRAVDGAMAAEFLRTLKGLLEEPAAMLL